MPQHPQMMRNQVLRPPAHPSKVANTELFTVSQRTDDHQPRRVAQGLGPTGGALQLLGEFENAPDLLCDPKVKAQEIALLSFLGHANILTAVDMILPAELDRACAGQS